jgi:hypothetical protein
MDNHVITHNTAKKTSEPVERAIVVEEEEHEKRKEHTKR